MAKRRRTSSRQRIASRKNILKAQKVSARKRRGIRKGVLVGVGAAAVLGTGIVAYRQYDRRQEKAQSGYLWKKAFEAQHSGNRMHEEYGGQWKDYDAARRHGLNPKQPRRYRNRPASIQSKNAIALHRKKVLGNRVGSLINITERVITTRAPYSATVTSRKINGAAFKRTGQPTFKLQRYDGSAMLRSNIGNRQYSTGFLKRRGSNNKVRSEWLVI